MRGTIFTRVCNRCERVQYIPIVPIEGTGTEGKVPEEYRGLLWWLLLLLTALLMWLLL